MRFRCGGFMSYFEKQIKEKIAGAIGIKNKDKIVIADYNDIDYPVYYEIKLERLN